MKKIYASLLVFFTIYGLHAQQVSGTVTDAKTNEPLPFVNVYYGTNQGTITNQEGKYVLELQEGVYQISFSFIGYTTQVQSVSVAKGQQIFRDVQLAAENQELQTVVISAGKYEQRVEQTTVSIEVIKPYLISNKNTLRLEETLNQTPGVQVTENQANIRSGSGWSYGAGSRVMVLVDDMPLMSPDAGQVQWKLLPNETLLQTEVIKGASSALYGTSALNGVINFRTISPTEVPQTEATIFTGIYSSPKRESLQWWQGNRVFVGANAFHAVKVKNVSYTGSMFLLSDPGYQLDVVDKRARLNFKTNVESTKIKGLNYGINTSALYNKGGDILIWHSYKNAYIAYDSAASISSGWDFYVDPNITYRKGKTKHVLKGRYMGINNNAQSATQNYENHSNSYYAEYQVQHLFENKLVVTGGLLGAWTFSDSEIFQGKHSTTNNAIYAQADKEWKRWNATLGVRYESFRLNARYFDKPVLRAGLNRQMAKATWLRASYGGGFRFPSMAESLTKTQVGAINVFPNQNLVPEEGWSAEIGLKQGVAIGNEWRGFVDIAAFLMRYNNMIEFSFGRWNNGPGFVENFGFKSINVGATQIAGAEMSFVGTGKIGQVGIKTLLGYAYMNPISLDPNTPYAYTYGSAPGQEPNQPVSYASSSSDTTNNILKYRYQHLAKADVQAEYKKWMLGASVRYNDFMQNIDGLFEDRTFSAFVPGVRESRVALNKGDFFLDLRLQYQVSEYLHASIIIDNVLNREFSPRPAALGAPRRFTLQLKASF